MRARVGDGVLPDILGKIGVVRVAVEGKFEHLHGGIAAALDQAAHAVVDGAEVLRDEVEPAQRALRRGEQFHPGALPPPAADRRFTARGDLVIAVEPAEMVDAHRIVQRKGAANTVDPPGKPLFLVHFPIVHGVAPELPRRRKIVGRDARHLAAGQVFVELEEMRVRPHVRRIVRDVQRQVADDAHAAGMRILLQSLPLPRKFILHEQPEAVFRPVLPQKRFERGGVAETVLLLPAVETLIAVRRFERHVQRVVAETPLLFKGAEGGVGAVEPRKGPAQERIFAPVQKAVIDPPRRIRAGRKLALFQQPLFGERVGVDEIGIARPAEHGLIGRIAVPRLHQRQHLPAAHARRRQKIDEPARLLPERADAVPARQGGNVQQHARLARSALPFFFHTAPLSGLSAKGLQTPPAAKTVRPNKAEPRRPAAAENAHGEKRLKNKKIKYCNFIILIKKCQTKTAAERSAAVFRISCCLFYGTVRRRPSAPPRRAHSHPSRRRRRRRGSNRPHCRIGRSRP